MGTRPRLEKRAIRRGELARGRTTKLQARDQLSEAQTKQNVTFNLFLVLV